MPFHEMDAGTFPFPEIVLTTAPAEFLIVRLYFETAVAALMTGVNEIESFTPSPFGEKAERLCCRMRSAFSVLSSTLARLELPVLPARSVLVRRNP
jgi:hypothetical protein